jgi:hypothetical protein
MGWIKRYSFVHGHLFGEKGEGVLISLVVILRERKRERKRKEVNLHQLSYGRVFEERDHPLSPF